MSDQLMIPHDLHRNENEVIVNVNPSDISDIIGRYRTTPLAGVEAGIRAFDGALAGLGGCPFAPGASGNAATEDLVWMFEEMGLRTGVNLDGLLRARAILAEALPGEALHGHLHQVQRAA